MNISNSMVVALVGIVFMFTVISAYIIINKQDSQTNQINEISAGQQQANVQLTLLPQGQVTENDKENTSFEIEK